MDIRIVIFNFVCMKTPNIDVLQDTVVIKQDKETVSENEFGLYMPDKLKSVYLSGTVVLVGDEVTELKTGDRVTYHKADIRNTTINGDELVLIKESRIFFKIVN